jgi:uncharacterized protein (DUF2126 family)
MYLIPGDSPMGYRLPLDVLPWSAVADRPSFEPPDPFAPRAPLASHAVLRPAQPTQPSSTAAAPATAPIRGESARGQVRTALCAEARDGVLYVFMPPVDTLDAYLELVAAIEATAADLGMPVLLEGYRPPSDPRLAEVLVTPDPGVIEVNVPPASTWAELVDQTTSLYEDAHRSRLTSEKFMLDGRHTGTGGGNHFVLGGATAEDSPLLRRPDLLRSLLALAQPSVAVYSFSGLFIGPTSQAPRLDEARQDSVYELDIAFGKVPPSGAPSGRRGSSTASSATCWWTSPEHAPRGVLHRTSCIRPTRRRAPRAA